MEKQKAKEAKAANREAKKAPKGRKRKGEMSETAEAPVKGARSKSAAKSVPKAAASKSKPKEPQLQQGQEPDIKDPDTRKMLADQGYDVLKSAGIAELTDGRELGSKKSFSVAPRDKIGSTIGVILYSSSFYVHDSIDQKMWPEKCADAGYNVMPSSSEIDIIFLICSLCCHVVVDFANSKVCS